MHNPWVVTADARPPVRFPSWREVVGTLAALTPLAISVRITYEESVVDVLQQARTLDLGALAGGAIACGLAVASAAALGRTARARQLPRAICALALAAA